MSPISPFTRDGHLHDLGLAQLATGELPEAGAVAAHLADCSPCRVALEAARQAAEAPLPPLRRPTPAPANNNRFWIPALTLAAALLVGVFVGKGPGVGPAAEERFTARGAALSLEVYKKEGESARRLTAGETVHAGDQLGFRVRHPAGGHLLVLGRDQSGKVYAAWPAGPAPAAAPVGPAAAPVTLDVAIQIDGQPGEEQLVALLCEAPLAWEEAASRLGADPSADPLVAGCAQDSLRLTKPAAP